MIISSGSGFNHPDGKTFYHLFYRDRKTGRAVRGRGRGISGSGGWGWGGGFVVGIGPQVTCSITGWDNFLSFLFATILNYNGRGTQG